MSTITFTSALKVSAFSMAQQRNDTEFRSIFGSQALEVIAPLWVISIIADAMNELDANEWKAFGLKLRGQTNLVEMWNIGRPVPNGDMRGTMTLNNSMPVGATTLDIIAATELSKTLLKGDCLGIGTGVTQQLVMVVENATSDGATGVINVTIEPALRNTHSIGASVEWDFPKALFRKVNSKFGWQNTGIAVDGFSLDLIEDWRP